MFIFKKILKIFSRIIACILITIIIYTIIHPTSMPDKLVEKYLFLKIHKGTSMEDALKEIEDEWKIKEINYDQGIYFGKTGQPITYIDEYYSESLKKDLKMVGNKFIFAELDEYNVPLNTVVLAYFIFDENDKLIQVEIRRDIDGL